MTDKIIKEQVNGETIYKSESGREIKTLALDLEDLINTNIGEVIALLRHSMKDVPEPSIIDTLCLRLLSEAATHLVDAYYFMKKHTGDASIICHDDYYDCNRSKETFLDVIFEPATKSAEATDTK